MRDWDPISISTENKKLLDKDLKNDFKSFNKHFAYIKSEFKKIAKTLAKMLLILDKQDPQFLNLYADLIGYQLDPKLRPLYKIGLADNLKRTTEKAKEGKKFLDKFLLKIIKLIKKFVEKKFLTTSLILSIYIIFSLFFFKLIFPKKTKTMIKKIMKNMYQFLHK